jgi:hypothetical protein
VRGSGDQGGLVADLDLDQQRAANGFGLRWATPDALRRRAARPVHGPDRPGRRLGNRVVVPLAIDDGEQFALPVSRIGCQQ